MHRNILCETCRLWFSWKHLANARHGLIQIEHKALSLGEVLDGDRMAVSLYNINFKGASLIQIKYVTWHSWLLCKSDTCAILPSHVFVVSLWISCFFTLLLRFWNFSFCSLIKSISWALLLFTVDVTKVELCKLTLTEDDVKRLREAIEDLYYYEIVIGKPLTYNLTNIYRSFWVCFTWKIVHVYTSVFLLSVHNTISII